MLSCLVGQGLHHAVELEAVFRIRSAIGARPISWLGAELLLTRRLVSCHHNHFHDVSSTKSPFLFVRLCVSYVN